MSTYYNEIDPGAAAWLRQLITAGIIPDGDVDERSITDVSPDDVRGYTQCHFFAGVGGWPIAARLAGWPDDRELWTGSAPCQPFSVAGKGKGTSDQRHLWPELYRLVRPRRPDVLMGEQVASPDGLAWLDGVYDDLEASDYTCGAVDIPASGVSAPIIRQRLYWVAEPNYGFRRAGESSGHDDHRPAAGRHEGDGLAQDGGEEPGGMGRAGFSGLQRYRSDEPDWREPGRLDPEPYGSASEASGGFWSDATLIGPDEDGAFRRIKSGVQLLAYGLPRKTSQLVSRVQQLRVDRRPAERIVALAKSYRQRALRGYGNAIVPELGAEVIQAYMEARCIAQRWLN